jgi:hypothetical protein
MNEAPVGDAEGDRFPDIRIDPHGGREARVDLLEVLYPLGGMEVERNAQPPRVRPREEGRRVGEQLAIPRVAGPAMGRVPVHVEHQSLPLHARGEGDLGTETGGEGVSRTVLEGARLRPLEAQEAWGEHGEACLPMHDDVGRVGYRPAAEADAFQSSGVHIN